MIIQKLDAAAIELIQLLMLLSKLKFYVVYKIQGLPKRYLQEIKQ